MGLPPSPGAAHRTVADALPPVAETFAGAAGGEGGAETPDLRTSVAIDQTVLAPVATPASGVAPWGTTWSSVIASMSVVGDMSTRGVKAGPAARVSLKPESA